MKKNIIISLSIVFSALLWNSCTKEIPFNQEQRASKIVVNSLFSTDTVWLAHISKSVSILDDADYTPIENANVEIFNSSGSKVASLSYLEEGFYIDSTSSPIPNQEYRIEVSAPNFTSVSAKDILPTPVPIVGLDTSSTRDAEGMTILQVDLTFNDPADADNYYLVEMHLSGAYEPWEEGRASTSKDYEFDYRLQISTNDPNVQNINGFSVGGFDHTYEYLLLSDRSFNGQNYTLSFSVVNWEHMKNEGTDLKGEIRLLNTSEAFYNYRMSFERYSQSNGNPFAQPTQVYSNVDKGIGIFAGGTLTTWDVDF